MNRFGLALIVLIAGSAGAETRVASPSSIDQYLDRVVQETKIPGLVAVATDAGGVFYSHAAGHQNVAARRDMTTSTIFRIASMTKPVTSVAVLMLVEEGQVALDDPIADYLPELDNREVLVEFTRDGFRSRPAKTPITVRHLLTHTSGLAYTFSNENLARMIGDEDAIPGPSAVQFPLVHEPGERWTYGESTRVLGSLVERLSHQPLETFLRERIFEPLEMNETSYTVPQELNDRVATVHRMTDSGFVEVENPDEISSPANGDGGLNSTALDYAKFVRMFLNGGRAPDGSQLLSEQTIRSMGQNHIGSVRVSRQSATNSAISLDFPVGAERDAFGLGFQVTGEHDDPHARQPGSMAWAGIYNTEFWIDPVSGIGAVLMMQYLPFYDTDAIDALGGFEARLYQQIR